ncbi:DUF5924 family protein [Rheinheimera tangshanensis]|jgi:hypothetical protein|uniref:DUF2914 domain-containing protein n=1 Tax=Rheinheimera tangshanensis TaxID=400153 RepID=A0A5C8M0A4_9GAMM|nr:DUF5924 family protein [Rheinheimera tangshanensis]TXK82931.1 DUF2914 domain-containing protein [Rheinheimera tangshanensis]GGM47751.1 hypothetical protein GCM10010920_05220 [Rheinheimera tangshanensis]
MQNIQSAFFWLIELTKKYSGLVALFGFCTGLFSLWQVERREEFAQFFAILMVIGWLWLMGEYWLRKGLLRKFGISLSKDVTHLITQLLHQESLFFALPFFLAATDWDQPQAVFTLVLVCCALVAVIDPAYNRLLTRRRALFLLYHCFSLFAVLMVVLPLLFFMTTTQSLGLALIISALLSIPSIRPLLAQPGRWRLPVLSLLLVVMTSSIWFSRSLIPAPVLNLTDIQLSQQMDYEQRLPGAAITELSLAELQQGLYAYTSVRAPRGLKEQIYHEWTHNGQAVERIALNISGGREEGYRAWTRKQQFPQDAVGKWKIRVVTDSGQLLGAIRFRVTP